MQKFKFFITDFGSMFAVFMLTLLMVAFTYYTFFCAGWLIAIIIYVSAVIGILWDRNETYKIIKKLRDKGYNV
jgi:hypothetical protein